MDLQGRVLLANRALLDLTGYHKHELVGRLIFDTLVISEDLVPAQASLRQAASAGTTAPVEVESSDRHMTESERGTLTRALTTGREHVLRQLQGLTPEQLRAR